MCDAENSAPPWVDMATQPWLPSVSQVSSLVCEKEQPSKTEESERLRKNLSLGIMEIGSKSRREINKQGPKNGRSQ